MNRKQVNAHKRLDDDPFTYRTTRDGRVFVARGNREVAVIAGARARKLIADLHVATSGLAKQLLLARVTGNYRRGNERPLNPTQTK